MSLLLSKLLALAPRDESLKALAALLDSLEAILEYGSAGKGAFMAERQVQDAVMYRLLCAGEATKRFFDCYEGKSRPKTESRLTQRNADVSKVSLSDEQWDGLMAMRDVLGHRIDEQNMEIVWSTVEQDVPLMVQPVWDALKWASLKWFEADSSPGRVRAKQKADEEMRELLGKLHSSITSVYQRQASRVLAAQTDVSSKLISLAVHRLRDVDTSLNASPAEIAMKGLTQEIDRQHKITIIAEHLEEVAWDESLESEAADYGHHAACDEILTEDVELDEESGAWSASIMGTALYQDDEDEEMGSDAFDGTASGTISEDMEVEVDEWAWERRGDDDGEEHHFEPGWQG